MTEIAFNTWYKAGDVQILKPQSLNVREGGKAAQVTGAERLRHEPSPHFHSDFLDESVRPSRCSSDNGFSSLRGCQACILRENEGMVKVWNRGDVPGAASH
jgi:hypothetical protein